MEGFTKKYDCKILVWFEVHTTMEMAILKEKQIKAGNRKQKIGLIENLNPTWVDLYETIV